ncbi:phosphotransferase [Motilimonas cestriensis]|uniref:Phosphotransferase n=1 Tax=Motilimonas cestriensis TaxID=2742685 RepID=A0ABS8WFE1_9GAMM|nr:phosphotransferase [Motilimonas cestriensis]MCE2596985.1 phosphotransferase [Motilimonas cestriensis]
MTQLNTTDELLPNEHAANNKVTLQHHRVYRETGSWTPAVHQLLTYLAEQQFEGVPQCLGMTPDGREVLTLVAGEVCDGRLTGEQTNDNTLQSAAKFLRQFHDCSARWSEKGSQSDWMLPVREPVEVICHGDYAPYNVAFKGEQVIGLFDFDTAHPGPRIWDLAYAIYCWAPFKTHPNDAMGTLGEQISRARLFCQAYGLEHGQRVTLVDNMIERLTALVSFMQAQAEQGNRDFQQHIAAGHHLSYLHDIDYLTSNQNQITQGLLTDP